MHRGPVISGFNNITDAAISMRWSGFDYSDEVRSVCLLNRAAGWDDFRNALRSFNSVSQNFVYADTEGNIGLNTGGGIALRKGNGSLISNGETDESDWKGYVPFEQLPFSFNPATGYVSSANNRTVDENYPYYISSDFAMPYRINRIRQMIGEKEIFTMDDFKRMILDQHSDYAASYPYILKIEEKSPALSPGERSALAALKNWDYDMNANLVAPSVFEFFRPAFGRNLLGDEMGELYPSLFGTAREYYIYRILTSGPDAWVDNVNTNEKETLDDIVLLSFKDAVSDLTKKFGEDQAKWTWGSIHKITIEHPLGKVKILDRLFSLNSDTYSVGGSSHTVSPYTYTAGFKVNHGASERHIFNTADWDESFTITPTGASGVPASEFYLSHTKDYIEGKFYKDAFTESAVKAAAKYTLILKSGK
ncbi:MAG: penicillin acylase family protein [Bacteroidales bacterium]|nr:penicillin acylase family protein [Bacteroidales bacterium]